MREDRLDSLVTAWQEHQSQGRDVSAAELCRDCPDLAEELSRRIAVLLQMNLFLQSSRAPSRPGAADAFGEHTRTAPSLGGPKTTPEGPQSF